jgi:hypothetical protein
MSSPVQEKKYTFDVAFGAECPNSKLYRATIAPLIQHVINGHNCTVFAYGATGSGKTYTMVGSSADTGLMVRSMDSLFSQTTQLKQEEDVTITASYLEVYNEVRPKIHAAHACVVLVSLSAPMARSPGHLDACHIVAHASIPEPMLAKFHAKIFWNILEHK